jgi:hypothetical protein
MYVLAAQRNSDVVGAFRRYREYLASVREHFPAKAYDLATSDWYFDSTHHHCPHDGWLESMTVTELSKGERKQERTAALSIELLGAYHDTVIKFHYQGVRRYDLSADSVLEGHGDWRYDEFRLSEQGTLIHEIEWRSHRFKSHWLIEANDVQFLVERVDDAI